MARARSRYQLGLVLFVAAGLLTAHQLGVFQHFHDPKQLARDLVALGPWGYAIFIGAYTVLQPFGVPGTVFIIAAPLIWPWPTAFALSMAGTMAASVVGFSFARFVARDWIASKIPTRFRSYDEALAERGFVTVMTLRFIFWMPPLLHAFFGVSKVPFWTHFWGSAVGYIVPLLATAYFGEKLFAIMSGMSLQNWLVVVLVVAATVLTVWWFRRSRNRARPADG